MPKEKFHNLLEDIRKTLEECPWAKEQTIETLKNEPVKEAKEVLDAINKNDFKNLREELGDLLYDVLLVSLVAERDGMLRVEDVISEINEKIRRRKPWCFGGEKVETSEQAVKRWIEIKQEEKNNKN